MGSATAKILALGRLIKTNETAVPQICNGSFGLPRIGAIHAACDGAPAKVDPFTQTQAAVAAAKTIAMQTDGNTNSVPSRRVT